MKLSCYGDFIYQYLCSNNNMHGSNLSTLAQKSRKHQPQMTDNQPAPSKKTKKNADNPIAGNPGLAAAAGTHGLYNNAGNDVNYTNMALGANAVAPATFGNAVVPATFAYDYNTFGYNGAYNVNGANGRNDAYNTLKLLEGQVISLQDRLGYYQRIATTIPGIPPALPDTTSDLQHQLAAEKEKSAHLEKMLADYQRQIKGLEDKLASHTHEAPAAQ